MQPEPPVVLSISEGHVATIKLNRPGRRNSIDAAMAAEWERALAEAGRDDNVHAIVITGAGPDFSIGLDLEELGRVDQSSTAGRKHFFWRGLHKIGFLLERIDKPVIAAINGVARGDGLDMALMCDLRIAGTSTRLEENRADLGMIAGDAGSYFLPRMMGCARTLEMFWMSGSIDAPSAERLGLVNRVVSDDELLPATAEIATTIAAKPQEAIRYFKRAVYQGLEMARRTHFDVVSSHMAILMDTDAHKEQLARALAASGIAS